MGDSGAKRRMDGQQQQDGAVVLRPNTAHGILSGEAVIARLGESAADLAALRSALWDDLRPVGALETMLADTVLMAYWRLRRVVVAESGLILARALAVARERGKASAEALAAFDAAHLPAARDVERITRYERGLTSGLHRALAAFFAAQGRREGRGDVGE